MSTLKTNNIEHLDASSASIQTTSGGGVIFAGISTFQVDANFDANVNIAGTITYEDVTSVDSVGVITARDAIVISEDNAIHFRGTAADDADAILRASAGGGQLLINSRNDAIINIDSNNDSTDAHFAVAHGAATGSSTELFRVQEAGGVLIGGHTTAVDTGNQPNIEIVNTSTSTLTLARNDTSIASGNDIAAIRVWGNDSNGTYQQCAEILAEADGDHGTGDKPTALAFKVTADGASSPTERFRIDSSGRVGINTNSFNDAAEALRVNAPSGQADTMLTIKSNNNGTGHSILNFGDDDFNEGRIIYDHSDNSMRFRTNDAEHMIINTSGNVMVATDSTQGGHNLSVAGDSLTPMVLRRNGSNGGVASFMKESNFVGSIVVDGSSTAYNESSDYRLKENIVNITDGITRVKQLIPRRFNFIIDADKTVDGFLAHEAATVVPEAVTGEYNAVDEDNNPVYQQIDKSKLVPLLTAALKEAIIKIETLEQRLTDAGL
jgi:hypothetical protein